ncbi:hypothetical protein CASFOL_025813 [Castilleja foliolosa]|uniref:Uncharacterized protein n=1 Tax=Castilleja foliolosa TaxID=1961234 RepID=A0ABD3CUH7_9LAMI
MGYVGTAVIHREECLELSIWIGYWSNEYMTLLLVDLMGRRALGLNHYVDGSKDVNAKKTHFASGAYPAVEEDKWDFRRRNIPKERSFYYVWIELLVYRESPCWALFSRVIVLIKLGLGALSILFGFWGEIDLTLLLSTICGAQETKETIFEFDVSKDKFEVFSYTVVGHDVEGLKNVLGDKYREDSIEYMDRYSKIMAKQESEEANQKREEGSESDYEYEAIIRYI